MELDEIENAKPAKPEGGKALERLRLFEQAREVSGTRPVTPRTAAARAASARADAAIGERYASAANALTAASGAPKTDGRGSATSAAAGTQTLSTSSYWRSLGPTFEAGGQTYGSARVDVSGRVGAIAVDPSNSSHIIVGSAAGGVWSSRDTGATWAPVADSAPTLTCGAVAFDPSHPEIVYIGTGEGNAYSSLGAGILRSVDKGETFSLLVAAPFVGIGFYDLVVDPRNGKRLFAATVGGFFVSTDGGLTWLRPVTDECWSLSLRTSGKTSELLAATRSGIKRSTNNGKTFAALNVGGPSGAWDRLAVAHAPSQPSTAYVWGSNNGNAFLAMRSGANWTAIANPPADTKQAWYDWFLKVAPDNPLRIFLGAVHAYRGQQTGATWTFENISSRQVGDSIHPDQHTVAFDPQNPQVMYVGNDGGVFRSPNQGTNWTPINQGLAISETEYLAQRVGTTNWILAGTQDNGSIRYTGGMQWEHSADGDGGDCGVNQTDGTTAFHSYYYMGMDRSTAGGASGTWNWIGPQVAAGYSSLFYPPLEVHGTTVAQAGESVFISRDSGSNWQEIGLGGGVATAMHAPTPDHLVVGTNSGRILRLDWNGSAWVGPTPLGSPRSAWMSDINVNGDRIWATSTQIGGGRVFRSDDGGANWTDRSAGLPDLAMNSVEVDPWNGDRIWVAADLGVYESFDAGATWSPIVAGLPNVLVSDLVVHPHARLLRAGTRNRGVWEYPIDDPITSPICGTQFNGQLDPNAAGQWFTFGWPAVWHMLWTVVPTSPQAGAPQLSFSTSVERANDEFATYWISIQNLTSAPITFEGRYAILSRS